LNFQEFGELSSLQSRELPWGREKEEVEDYLDSMDIQVDGQVVRVEPIRYNFADKQSPSMDFHSISIRSKYGR
jgi:hypothetical protein